ncbi:MAG: EF-hand domain-containing protein [Verrucomicrobium sp.]|nr:EF-hand domain-containing protein [Verrucomicrobium sp.]
MKTMLTLFALALSASLALAADGDKPKKPGGPEGGKRNPEEAFKKLDANGDGFLSKDEFKAAPFAQKNPERAEKGFENKDKDKDGKVSKEEFVAKPEGKPGKPEGDKPAPKPEGDKPAAKPEGDKKPA